MAKAIFEVKETSHTVDYQKQENLWSTIQPEQVQNAEKIIKGSIFENMDLVEIEG